MNLCEFKAWFEGFTENLDKAPNAKQWARIQAKVKQIVDAPPVSYPVYIDRYWPSYYPRWSTYYGNSTVGYAQNNVQASAQNLPENVANGAQQGVQMSWTSTEGFRALGRADAEQEAA